MLYSGNVELKNLATDGRRDQRAQAREPPYGESKVEIAAASKDPEPGTEWCKAYGTRIYCQNPSCEGCAIAFGNTSDMRNFMPR